MKFIMTLTVTLTLTMKYLQFFEGSTEMLHTFFIIKLTSCDGCLHMATTRLTTVFGISHNPCRTMTLTFDG